VNVRVADDAEKPSDEALDRGLKVLSERLRQ